MSQSYTMRVYFDVQGGHTHLQIWTGKTGYSLGKAGDICMTNEEFEAFKNNTALVEFVDKSNGTHTHRAHEVKSS